MILIIIFQLHFYLNQSFSECVPDALESIDVDLTELSLATPAEEAAAKARAAFFKKLEEARKFKYDSVAALDKTAETYQKLIASGNFTAEDVALLKKAGFEFSSEGKMVKIPLPERLARNYSKYMDELIAAGKIKKEDVLYPGRIVAPTPHPSPLTFPPARFVSFEEALKAGEQTVPFDVLDDNVFASMLSQGFFPMGDIDQFLQAGLAEGKTLTMYEHDAIGHFVRGFMKDPDYMKAIKQSYTPEAIKARIAAAPKGTLPGHFFAARHNIILEQLCTVKKESNWRELPGIPAQMKNGQTVGREELMAHYMGLSDADLLGEFEKLDKEVEKIIRPVAGNNASGIEGREMIKFNKMSNADPCSHIHSSFLGVICKMRLAFADPEKYKGLPVAEYLKQPGNLSKEWRAEKMSELLIAAQELEKITAAEWASAALAPTLDSKSKLYQVLCLGELAKMNSITLIRLAHGCPN